jgi:tetratricopeptide (TPR) repeat protein
MKVFLSHSTKDADFVKQLAAAIIGAGFDPWLCEVDVEKNANFVSHIEKALAACDVALVVWSPDAAASHWTTEEWTSVLSRQVKEQRVRLGIVMLREHPLPQLLRTKNYISAQRDPQAGLRETVEWLKRVWQAQRLSGLKSPVYLPDYRAQDFVGRVAYLGLLRQRLVTEPAVFLLFGEPGTGKSTVALQFAWETQNDFDAVIFQTCGQRPLDAITTELADRLPIDVKTLPPDAQRSEALQWLKGHRSLLVLDDVWSPEVRQLAPGPACSVLYTSRKQALSGIASAQAHELEAFTDEECKNLFHATLDPIFEVEEVSQHEPALLGFARKVEMLPIAVAVGASLLREKAAIRLDKGVAKLKPEALTDGVKNVPELFRKAIDSQPAREQKLLAACAVCVQEGFWLPLATQIAGLSEEEADDAASVLVNGSLLRVLDRDRRRFQMHALLREQLRARAGKDELDDLQERHATALESFFEDREKRWQDCRECLEEIPSAAGYLWASGQRSRQGNLTAQSTEAAARVGELDIAMGLARQEESFWVGRDDAETKDVLQGNYGNQAIILYLWGRLEDAMALHKQQEAICLELGNRSGLAGSYGNQALILKDWGRLKEALALHKKEEAIAIELGSKDQLQRSYGNQANILREWGRLKKALALHKKEEAIAIELGSKDQLQRSYGNQALIFKAWGRMEEAMALHEKEEAICLELGNKDSLQQSYGNQANNLRMQGQLDRSMELFKKQEAICLELGNKSDLGYCYCNWGLLARAQGDHETEKRKLQQALALFTELKMPRERDAIQAELDQLNSAD